MKIIVSFYQPIPTDVQKAILHDNGLKKKYSDFDQRFIFDTDKDEFKKILELTKNTSGIGFQSNIGEFTEAELEEVGYFELHQRKMLYEKMTEYKKILNMKCRYLCDNHRKILKSDWWIKFFLRRLT